MTISAIVAVLAYLLMIVCALAAYSDDSETVPDDEDEHVELTR